MKKILFLLLAIPLSVSALSEKDIDIKCENLKIGNRANCTFKINNSEKLNINSVSFDLNESLLDIKSSYELKKDEKYQINLKTNDEAINAFNFEYLMEYNNMDINLRNLSINYEDETFNLDNFSKNLQIENVAYIDNILVNNQPIVDFDKNVYNYKVDLYEKNDYVEIKSITSGNNTVEQPAKVYSFISGSTVNITVKNGLDTENYRLTLVYNKQGLKVKDIKIKEIPFNFVATKRYYYLEVTKDIAKITIENGLDSKKYDLNVGQNKIVYNNNGINYMFVINRLRQNKSINLSTSLKSLKIGETYLNLKEESYNYTFPIKNMEIVEIEAEENQDYDIKYNDDKIVVNLYDATANKTTYTINILDANTANQGAPKYSKAKLIIVFVIFLILFMVAIAIAIKKYKPFKIN